jgi:hypothetical protein
MPMKKILKLAASLARIREKEKEIKSLLDSIKEEKREVQAKLIEEMSKLGLKSLKTDTHNFARIVKKDVSVCNESAVISSLKKAGIKDDYVHEKLDVLAFKGYAKALLKNKGELLDGTDITESEYMSIKSVK